MYVEIGYFMCGLSLCCYLSQAAAVFSCHFSAEGSSRSSPGQGAVGLNRLGIGQLCEQGPGISLLHPQLERLK